MKSLLIIKAVSKGKDSSETISKEKPSSQVSNDKHTTSSHGSKVHKQSSQRINNQVLPLRINNPVLHQRINNQVLHQRINKQRMEVPGIAKMTREKEGVMMIHIGQAKNKRID